MQEKLKLKIVFIKKNTAFYSHMFLQLRLPVDNIYCCFQILRCLFERFQSVIQILLMDNSDKFTYWNIVLHLIAEETCIELQERKLFGNHNTEIQLVSKQAVPKRIVSADDSSPRNNVFKPEVTYYKCKQREHYANHCTKIVPNQLKSKRSWPTKGSNFVKELSFILKYIFQLPSIFSLQKHPKILSHIILIAAGIWYFSYMSLL